MYLYSENYSEPCRSIGTTTEINNKPEITLRAFYIPTRMTHELESTNAKKGLTMSRSKFMKLSFLFNSC